MVETKVVALALMGTAIEEDEEHSSISGLKTVGKLAVICYFFPAGAGGDLTLFDSHARPSSSPSPVVAQLGTTYQTLSFSLSSWRALVTSCGFIAVGMGGDRVKTEPYVRKRGEPRGEKH